MNMYRTSCCGVVEFDGLSIHGDAASALKAVKTGLTLGPGRKAAFVMFTGVVRIKGAHGHLHTFQGGRTDNYGQKFAEFIEREGLGTVQAMPVTVNPASGNDLGVWMWGINHDNLEKWFEANP